MRRVSVALPVLDGARYLPEVLEAVNGQEVEAEVDLVVVDSGSSDGSAVIAEAHGARVHRIPNREFSHGGTRNLLMELAEGDHVAFLTQDSTPAHTGWLAALLEGFEAADQVGAVFGPHDPRPGASHMIAAEMDRHFGQWGKEIDVQRIDFSPAGLAAYRRGPGRWTFLSSVNLCLARWAWERIPFHPVPYAEDQLLGRELVEAGLAKAYHPRAQVWHSHDYAPVDFLRRYFDEWRSLREVLDHVQPAGPRTTLRDVRGLIGADRRWLRGRGIRGRALVRPLMVSGRHHSLRMAGAITGSRADRLPQRLRGALSLAGRDSFEPIALANSALLSPVGKVTVQADAWSWEFVRRAHPARPTVTVAGTPRSEGPMTLAWVIPTWRLGSGGHTTIFRLVGELERRGHACALFVFDPFGREKRSGLALRRELEERFPPVRAPLFRGLEDLREADIAIATNWWTAWPVRAAPGCRAKAYLVQDHEPDFDPLSAPSVWAAETYRSGLSPISYTRWMAEELRDRYGVEGPWFECGTDLDIYTWGEEHEREPGLVAVYARQETARRAVELALAGAASALERRPGTRFALFGTPRQIQSPIPVDNLGVLSPRELAALYRRASAGIVFSLTTHSLVAQEMMAAGLPLVELDGKNVTSELGASGERALLVPPRADAVAEALVRLLDGREEAMAMARRAREWVEPRTWEHATDQVEAALRATLAR